MQVNNPRFGHMAPYNSASQIRKELQGMEYHAHVYYDPKTQMSSARALHDEAADVFKNTKVTVGQLRTQPNLPTQKQTEFEIEVPGNLLGPAVHYLSTYRRGLQVLFHKLDFYRLVPTHTGGLNGEAFVLGAPPQKPLVDLQALAKIQEEVDSGKRAAVPFSKLPKAQQEEILAKNKREQNQQ